MLDKYMLYTENGLPSLVREGEVNYSLPKSVSSGDLIEPDDVAGIFINGLNLGKMPEEYSYLVLIQSSRIKGISEIGHGGFNLCPVDIKSVFLRILLAGATSFILVHNHPSGSLMPSSDDLLLTRQLKKAGDIMGIKFLDHIIIAGDSFYSLLEEGCINN